MSPLRRLLPKTELHVREVEAIDLENQTITTSTGFHPHPHVVHCDHLVLALGTVTDFRGLRGLPEHAFPFKNLSDALNLRNHVIRALEEAAIERPRPGPRGASSSRSSLPAAGSRASRWRAELERLRPPRGQELLEHRPARDPRRACSTRRSRILPEMDERLATFAQRILTGAGRRSPPEHAPRCGDRRRGAAHRRRTRIPCKTLVSTVPASPHPLVESLSLPKTKNGRIEVDATLAAAGYRPASGPSATARRCPHRTAGSRRRPRSTRPARRRSSRGTSSRRMRGGTKKAYAFRGLGKMGSLGRRSAVAEVFGVKIYGLPRLVPLADDLPLQDARMGEAAEGRRASWTLDLVLAARARAAAAPRLAGRHAGALRAGPGGLPPGRRRRPHLHRPERPAPRSSASRWLPGSHRDSGARASTSARWRS